ncbi:hypothetical protein BGZ75_008927 [Mortierella antarctica]|nr:hypothetical protein BGZ75_008927 [Mortierella antarctica]
MSRLSFCCPGTCALRAKSTVDLRTQMRLMSTLKRPHNLDGAPLIATAPKAAAAAARAAPTMTSAYLVKRFYTPPPAKQHFYQNRILDPYVSQPANPITLRQLVFFGRNMQADKLIKSANYVRTELPIRLAHRIRDFQNLPFIVGTNPHIERVYTLYWQAFEALRTIPEIKTLEENDAFCKLVKHLLNDHLVVIPQLALGIMESAKHLPAEMVDQFMNKMLRSRISRRVLAEQHISLTANYNSPNHMMTDRGYIGIIYTHCSPREIVERTAILAAETCRRQYAIEIQRAGNSHGQKQQQRRRDGHHGALEPPKVIMDGSIDAEFSYIPDHIEYILYELLKNSMRFVMLNAKLDPSTGELPPIQITVCEGTHDIVFRVSDKGGGIDPELESHLWSYSQSPARFANFQKISRMAATVQEQLVSPCRSADVGHQDEVRNEDDDGTHKGDVEQRDSSTGSEDHGMGRDLVLPPPPVNLKAGTTVEESFLLDRHSPSRTMASTMTATTTPSNSATMSAPAASSSSSSSSPSIPPSSSGSAKAVIDPNQSATPQKKAGHLDTEARQKTERQQDETMHLGIGLPMSRVYAEYWGGDLKVYTMHGYGTDAYARLCKFGNIYENFDV